MPRGSKPGERRGGRQKGTPNKRTVFNNAMAAAAAADPGTLPLDLFLNVMRNREPPLDTRIMAAQSALPYVHAKPLFGQGPEPGSRVKIRLADDDADLTPLNFLLRVMHDHETPSHTRMRVGSIMAPYIHRKAKPRVRTPAEQARQIPPAFDQRRAGKIEVEDPYGFVIDWAKAEALRDLQDQLETLPQQVAGLRFLRTPERMAEKRDQLWAAIAEKPRGSYARPPIPGRTEIRTGCGSPRLATNGAKNGR